MHVLRPYLVLGLLAVVCCSGVAAWAQQDQTKPQSSGRPFSLPIDPEKFVGVEKCADCHNAPSPLRSTDWSRLTEFAQWRARDKHALAYKQLDTPRGRQIGKALWGVEDVTKRRECLSCHANWVNDAPQPAQINLQEGVACESCHGPAKDYLSPHVEVAWRTTSNEKKRELGMVNVRDPQERARQCLSCHIGNAEEGKLLTHDMYAAGHPPLPGIEIETFAHNMPPHWRTLNQKVADLARLSPPKQLPDLPKLRELLAQPERELHGVKSVLVGGLMNLREAVHLVGQQSGLQKESGPEFALFDCAMCHHELQTPSWRQARMLSGRLTPGRPQLHRWPAALVDAALVRAAGRDAAELKMLREQFAGKQGALQAIFNKSPFGVGRGGDIANASQGLVEWLDTLVERVSTAGYDRSASEAVLIDLCRSAQKSEYLDYDSARQVAWALRTISQELKPSPGNSTAVTQVLAEMTAALRLDLPWGQAKQILDPAEQQAAFKAVSNYDPQPFQQQVARLLAALGAASADVPR
jgi:hypothetical protein